MRLSVCKEDSGYNPLACRNVKIFFDNIEVTNRCHTADDESGTVWLYLEDDEGKKYTIPSDDFEYSVCVAQEMLRGNVEIKLNT